MTLLYLDNDYTIFLTQLSTETTSIFTQEIVIPIFDRYHNIFGSGTGIDCITTTIHELKHALENFPIFKDLYTGRHN